jgi:hypothetical protein
VSYWVSLLDPVTGTKVLVPIHQEGGTYASTGLPYASMDIPYKYDRIYTGLWRGKNLPDMVHDKRAEAVIPLLEAAVMELGVMSSPDYWEPTPGNAGHALSVLLAWAHQHPLAVFEVL